MELLHFGLGAGVQLESEHWPISKPIMDKMQLIESTHNPKIIFQTLPIKQNQFELNWFLNQTLQYYFKRMQSSCAFWTL